MTEKLHYKKKIAAAFASLAFVMVGAANFLTNESLDIYSVINILTKAIPAVLTLGLLGFWCGSIFDDKRVIQKHFVPSSFNAKHSEVEVQEVGAAQEQEEGG